MYCQKCGASNPEGATFCASCGSPLAQPTSGSASSTSAGFNQVPVQRKSPIIAALLSFFLFGIGYLYLGTKKILGIPTILFVVIILIVYVGLGFFTFGLLGFVVGIILAYDSYVKAKGERGVLGAEPEYLYRKTMQ